MKEKKKLSLSVWIFIGMIAGILVGLCFLKTPEFTTDYLKPIGTIYINLLKFLVVPVVLFTITDGVVSLKDLKRVGSVGHGRRHPGRREGTYFRAVLPRG